MNQIVHKAHKEKLLCALWAAISNVASAKRCHQPKHEAGDISEQLWVPVGLEMSPLLRRDDTSNRATLEIAALCALWFINYTKMVN